MIPRPASVSTIYDAPEEYQTYASAMGYQPGSPEYRGALSDYVLRGYGPTAAGVRSDLQQERFAGQAGLEGIRQGNRVALRGMPTYRDTHRPAGNGHGHSGATLGSLPPRTTGNVYAPILAKVARGEALSPGEQQVLNMRGGGGRGHASGGQTQTATDPRTGRKVQWNGASWVPAN
jgi:hypothetical protein